VTYSELKIQLYKDSIPSHRIKATQNFFGHNTPDIVSSQKWKLHSTDSNLLHYSVWDTLQQLVCEGKREPYANFKDLHNVITDKWHDVDIRQPESEKP